MSNNTSQTWFGRHKILTVVIVLVVVIVACSAINGGRNSGQGNSGQDQENARRALCVAAENSIADDVFASDGNTYDPSKFHTYVTGSTVSEAKGFYLWIDSAGTCTSTDKDTWHIADMEVTSGRDGLDSNTDYILSGDVTYDGTNYIITDLSGQYETFASSGKILKGDFDFMVKNGDAALTVSPDMIKD